MPSTPNSRDEDVRYESSPLDPWGLLDPAEKAAAAIRHAELVRTPKPPIVVSPPAPEPEVRPEWTVCIFGRHYSNEAGSPVTHRLTRSRYPEYPVGSYLCQACATRIQRDYHVGPYEVEPLFPGS